MATKNFTTKRCKDCHVTFPPDCFYFVSQRDGKGFRRGECKSCTLLKQKQRKEKRKQENGLNAETLYAPERLNLPRVCSICKTTLLLRDFHKDITQKDGYSNRCKSCSSLSSGQWYASNTEYAKAAVFVWRQKNSDKVYGYQQRYVQRYPARVRAASRTHYATHLEAERQRSRLKKSKREDRVRRLRDVARAHGFPAIFRQEDATFMHHYWQFQCAVCGQEEGLWHVLAFDHWIPIASPACPGTVVGNIVPLCHAKRDAPFGVTACNQAKGAKDPMVWLVKHLGKRRAKAKLQEIETFFVAAMDFAIKNCTDQDIGREIVAIARKRP